jgi:omega-6 fatty acid desaturase (delta-12 desaturase)
VSRYKHEVHSNRWYLFAYIVIIVLLAREGMLADVAIWYLPAWVLQLTLDELVNLPHHADTPLLASDAAPLPLWEQHRVTHSCGKLWFWSSCVLLNFNLHTAHHLYPWIPWSGLPEAHALLMQKIPELEAQLASRNEFSWSLRNRRRPLLEIMRAYFDRIPQRENLGC